MGMERFRQRHCKVMSDENSWHWRRDIQLDVDDHRYREQNGAQIPATLRSLAMKALRWEVFSRSLRDWQAWPVTSEGLLALLGWRKPLKALNSD